MFACHHVLDTGLGGPGGLHPRPVWSGWRMAGGWSLAAGLCRASVKSHVSATLFGVLTHHPHTNSASFKVRVVVFQGSFNP